MDIHRSWGNLDLRLEGSEKVNTGQFKGAEPGLDDLQAELQRLQQQLEAHGNTYWSDELPQKNPVGSSGHFDPPPPGCLLTPMLSPDAVPFALSPRRKKAARDPTKESKKQIQMLRRQLAEEREELRKLRALRGATEETMTARIKRLEERVKTLLNREQTFEKRRLADVEGWRAELTGLRQRLQSIERRQRRLAVVCSVPDEDHRDAVLARHRKLEAQQSGEKYPFREAAKWHEKWAAAEDQLGRAAPAEDFIEKEEFLGDEEALQSCLTELTEELSALKFALGGLEEKII